MKRCESIVCNKPLPVETRFGNKISNHRQKKQKYCNNACARREAARRKREQERNYESVEFEFLYKMAATK